MENVVGTKVSTTPINERCQASNLLGLSFLNPLNYFVTKNYLAELQL